MTKAATVVVPAVLFPIAAVLVIAQTLPESLHHVMRAAPLAIFGGGAVLGIIIRRGRLVLALTTLVLADQALIHFPNRPMFIVVAVLLPLNIGVIASLREASLLSNIGAWRLGIVLSQALVAWAFQLRFLAGTAQLLDEPLIGSDLSQWTQLPQLALIAFAMALGLVLARYFISGRPLAAGAAWSLVACYLALDSSGSGGPVTVYFLTAGVLLVVGSACEVRNVFLDEITGLPAKVELDRMLRRTPRRYALARIDVDEYVRFRERYGPEGARRMLRAVANALTKIGGRGRAFSYGGPAFAVVFRWTTAHAAMGHLDFLRHTIEALAIDIQKTEPPKAGRPAKVEKLTVSVTISGGVAEPETRDAKPEDVVRAAEQALARAKQAGSNRISLAVRGAKLT